MSRFWHFVQYHNAIPIAFSILFIGSGTVLAASPEVRDVAGRAVFESQTQVVSVDNTYIANKDFSAYTPQVHIVEVTEDDDYYYVQYQFTTIDVIDHVWQDVTKDEQIKVSKADLGPHKDLGVYVTEQLGQKVNRELAYLKEVQQFEKAQVSQKVVATAYSGLVGAFLDDKTETIPGYTPRVVAPAFTQPVPNAGLVGREHNQPGVSGTSASSGGGNTANTTTGNTASGAPEIQILGKNPAYLSLGATYADLGAVVSDDKDVNLGIKRFLNGKETSSIQIDTSTTSEWVVRYESTDNDGNVGAAERRVIVYDPANPPQFEETQPAQTPTAPAPQQPTETPTTTTTPTTSSTPAQQPKTQPATTTPVTSPTTTPATTTPATTTSPTTEPELDEEPAQATTTPPATEPEEENEPVEEEIPTEPEPVATTTTSTSTATTTEE